MKRPNKATLCDVLHTRSSRSVTGEYAQSLVRCLEYLDFLSTMRINFSDQMVLTYDDNFWRSAASEKFRLGTTQEKNSIASKHFHSDMRKAAAPNKPTNELFREHSGFQKSATVKRYCYPCCHKWQKNNCPYAAAECAYKHTCGDCNGGHQANNCTSHGGTRHVSAN